MEELDEVEDKLITLILGEDNVAVAVIIEDEVAGKDFLTAYDANKKKITVGGTKYTLASDVDSNDDNTDDAYGYTVELNGTVIAGTYGTTTPIAAALAKIDATMDVEKIEKKIQAEVRLNDDDKVKAIELTASAYIDGISDEVLVTKVKETNSKYTITTTNAKITWNIEEEEDGEVEFPKVYVDGVRADIRDIVPGMVLSVYGTDLDVALELDDTEAYADLKIYATTTGVVDGEATRIKKANLAITLDGTVYAASNANVTMSTEELAKYDNSTRVSTDYEAVVDNETVTLYLNMFGEYAFVTLDEVASNWTFGVVTYVSSNITWEGEDEEIAVRNIKVLLADGSKKTYKLKVDTEDDDITEAVQKLVVGDTTGDYETLIPGDFVAFEANTDKVITIEDGDEVIKIAAVDTDSDDVADDVKLTKLAGTTATKVGDYAIEFVGGETVDKDDEEFGDYEYTSKTVIFNTNEKELVTKWKAILNGTAFKDLATIAIFEDEDEEEALYMIVALDESAYGNEDAIYAVVEESENVGDKNYVKFVGSEEMEAKDTVGLLDEGWLVAYRTASSKVSAVQELINMEKLKDATDVKYVADYLAKDDDGNLAVDITFDLDATLTDTLTETKFVKNITETTRLEQIVLDEVDIKTSGKITLKYVETDHDDNSANDDVAIDSVKLDKDAIKVYDLRNGNVEEIEVETLRDEVADGEEVYVLVAVNGDYDADGANVVFIIK